MVWLYISLIIVFMFIVSLFTRIYTKIFFFYTVDRSYVKVEIRLFGIRVINKEIPLVISESDHYQSQSKEQKEQPNGIEEYVEMIKNLKMALQQLIEAKPILVRIIAKVNVHHCRWETRFGTGNASATGMLCGGIWGVKGFFAAMINNYMKPLKQPEFKVIPIFQQKYAFVELECMFSMRLGQTIYAIIQLLKQVQTYQTNMKKTAQS